MIGKNSYRKIYGSLSVEKNPTMLNVFRSFRTAKWLHRDYALGSINALNKILKGRYVRQSNVTPSLKNNSIWFLLGRE